jgi:hypothetical protein
MGVVDVPQRRTRRQLYDNIYYIVMGVMVWPVLFTVCWILANKGYARRLRMVMGWLIGWAHNKVNKWDDTQRQNDNSASSQELSLIPDPAHDPMSAHKKFSKFYATPLGHSPTSAAEPNLERSSMSRSWSDDGDVDGSGRSRTFQREWSGGYPPFAFADLVKQVDDETSTRKVCAPLCVTFFARFRQLEYGVSKPGVWRLKFDFSLVTSRHVTLES